MERRTFVFRMGAVTLAAAFFISMMLSQDDDVAPVQTSKVDLFPFLKPVLATPATDDVKDMSADRQDPGRTPSTPASGIAAATPTHVASVEALVQGMRTQGASEDEIYRVRAAGLSAEAAAQLAGMDREETAWQRRIHIYLAERGRLLDGRLPGAEQTEALQRMRDARFTPEEQDRLAAHESGGAPQLKLQ